MNIKISNDSLNKRNYREKIYIQFDKPYYALNDTIWFKAYLFDPFLMASEKSGIINLNVSNETAKISKNYKITVKDGLGSGNISLDENDGFKSGTYTISAYTNWMRNFGEDFFFNRSFYLIGNSENEWLIRKHRGFPSIFNDTVKVKLTLSDINKKPVSNKALKLQLLAENRNISKEELSTDGEGQLDFKFKLPLNNHHLQAVLSPPQSPQKAILPLILPTLKTIDLQFMPEGGYLVSGLTARVGFKAVGEDGRGVQVSGYIINQKEKRIVSFNGSRTGLGNFELIVKKDEQYTALVTLAGGGTKRYPLPTVKPVGTVIKITNNLVSDSLEVAIAASDEIIKSNKDYFLIAKARGVICYAASFGFRSGQSIKKKIAKNLFPAGIANFLIMTTELRPMNERLTFINKRNDGDVRLSATSVNRGSVDSITMHIKLVDQSGKPVKGNLSMSVTDDSKVNVDTLKYANILTQMLLTGDLKGYIDEPNFYLSGSNDSWQALDNLLITQGWVGYDWDLEFNKQQTKYRAVRDFSVHGRVTNVFNKPVKNSDILLLSMSPSFLKETSSDINGEFHFNDLQRIDSPLFVLKAGKKNGKSSNLGISVYDDGFAEILDQKKRVIPPWYISEDTTSSQSALSDKNTGYSDYNLTTNHRLGEVKIIGKKIVKNSQNLNGSGNADLALSEKDLEKVPNRNWLQILQDNIKGFRYLNLPPRYPPSFYINFKEVIFVVDGVVLTSVYSIDFTGLKDYLQSHNADDLKGIEVMSSNKFVLKYSSRFYPNASSDNLAFIEITTRSGNGPVIVNSPGIYVYKPAPIIWPKSFYKPRFGSQDRSVASLDFNSTVDWEPNIATDANGEATVGFNISERSENYTIIIEGTNMNGDVFYRKAKILATKSGIKLF